MRRPTLFLFSLFFAACGPGTGKLYARVSSDPALAMPFTTADGWSLQFSHVVVQVGLFTVTGSGTNAFPEPQGRWFDFSQNEHGDLAANLSAVAKTYDGLSLDLARRPASANVMNVNVPADVLARAGDSTLWVEGTASKQSTTRLFRLGLSRNLTYEGCMPAVNLEPAGSATVDWRVRAQRLFEDDAGQLRFDAFGAADAAPADGTVSSSEVAAVMSSTLPSAHYGSTSGTLTNVLEKRALGLVGLGDTGTCTGR